MDLWLGSSVCVSQYDKDGGGTLDGDEFKRLVRLDLKIPLADLEDADIEKLVAASHHARNRLLALHV